VTSTVRDPGGVRGRDQGPNQEPGQNGHDQVLGQGRHPSAESEAPDPVPAELDLSRVPVHVACVMDGNGRWASARGLPRTEGHAAGEEALLDVVDGALAIGIKWITLYAFSTENWRRPPDEVRYLMNFNQSLLMRRRDELNEKGVQIRFAGRRDWRVPRRVLKRMDESIELTKDNRRMVMTMAFNYGGRAEIVDAVRALVAEGTPASKVDEKAIARHLYFPDMPDPDLVIRTSGETRISNFLLWEIAYSELVFTDVLWPDFRRQHLFDSVREYQERERRFGGIDGT
jgi:undecaprenyl diphosphate synthase